ncbi:MAG TPA: hypothetical protein VF543_19355 [Pyrinomonadaceae bacterium]|jgi:hypothetical protein
MKVYAQKQSQQQSSSNLISSSAQPLAASEAVHPLIQLQRMIGNQAVQRLISANAQQDDEPVVITKNPSPRALMLLDMFIKNRSSFKGSFENDFRTEAKDKDASEESIQVKEREIYWTLKFVANNKTGVIYVRQSQDGTATVNWYQGVMSEKAAPAQEKPEGKCAQKGNAPFSIHYKKPLPTGNIESKLEQFLIMVVNEIKAKSSPPKEIRVCVTLFNVPGESGGNIEEKFGVNIKKFMEAQLPASIKITEVHEVEASTEYYLLTEVTPVY